MREAVEAMLKDLSSQHSLMMSVAQKNSSERKWEQVISNVAEIMSIEHAHRVAITVKNQLDLEAPKEQPKTK